MRQGKARLVEMKQGDGCIGPSGPCCQSILVSISTVFND